MTKILASIALGLILFSGNAVPDKPAAKPIAHRSFAAQDSDTETVLSTFRPRPGKEDELLKTMGKTGRRYRNWVSCCSSRTSSYAEKTMPEKRFSSSSSLGETAKPPIMCPPKFRRSGTNCNRRWKTAAGTAESNSRNSTSSRRLRDHPSARAKTGGQIGRDAPCLQSTAAGRGENACAIIRSA
jgi:hypothetical protein